MSSSSDFILAEHKEVPGNITACPSGRIRWNDILARLQPAPPLPDFRDVAVAGAEATVKLQRGEPLNTMTPESQKAYRDVVALL